MDTRNVPIKKVEAFEGIGKGDSLAMWGVGKYEIERVEYRGRGKTLVDIFVYATDGTEISATQILLVKKRK